MKRRLILPFIVLAFVPFIMVLGNSMLIPVFPQLERELNLTQFQVGLLVTAFSIPAGIVIPFAGALSDHIGRKRIMFPALLLYGLGGLGAGFASLWLAKPYGWILAARILQGVGAGGTYQIALALTGDLFQGKERPKAVGILEAANGLGKVISPVAGAALGLLVWFAPFFTYGILAIPIAFAVWLLVDEPKSQRQKQSAREYLDSLKAIFAQKGVPLLAVYLAGAVGLFLLFGMLSFVSDELELAHNLTGVMKGVYLAIPVAVMAACAYAMGIVLQDRDQWLKPVILAGLLLAAAGIAGLSFLTGIVALMVLTSVMGLGIGSKLPALNTLVTGATQADERGLITALYGTVRFFGVAIGPPAFGLVQGLGRMPMFLAGGGIALLALVLIWWLMRPSELLVQDSTDQSPSEQRSTEGAETAETEKGPSEPEGTPGFEERRGFEPLHSPGAVNAPLVPHALLSATEPVKSQRDDRSLQQRAGDFGGARRAGRADRDDETARSRRRERSPDHCPF